MNKVERTLMVIGGLTVGMGLVDVGQKAVAGVKNYLQIRKMIKEQNEAELAKAIEACALVHATRQRERFNTEAGINDVWQEEVVEPIDKSVFQTLKKRQKKVVKTKTEEA